MAVPNATPELLYHTTLTVIEHHEDSAGSTRSLYVLGTHANLDAAKAFAATALRGLGYEKEDFETFEVRRASSSSSSEEEENVAWKHGDGVVVYAKAPAGHELLVGLDTTPNNESLPSSPDGSGGLRLPSGAEHLHYVVQTKTDYNQDTLPSGSGSMAYQSSEIEGCYAHRADALEAARRCLISGGGGEGEEEEEEGRRKARAGFAQYDERDSVDMEGQWPFGEDVVVHAVAQTGENYIVAVRTALGALERHGKHAKKH